MGRSADAGVDSSRAGLFFDGPRFGGACNVSTDARCQRFRFSVSDLRDFCQGASLSSSVYEMFFSARRDVPSWCSTVRTKQEKSIRKLILAAHLTRSRLPGVCVCVRFGPHKRSQQQRRARLSKAIGESHTLEEDLKQCTRNSV